MFLNIQNTTLFAPRRLEYDIPKEKVSAEKQRFNKQREMSFNNQEEALWRLQKLTPIISVLDKPTAPFIEETPYFVLNTFVDFKFGCLLTAFILVFNIIYKYIKMEISKSLLDTPAI